jgi:hypothetical protein
MTTRHMGGGLLRCRRVHHRLPLPFREATITLPHGVAQALDSHVLLFGVQMQICANRSNELLELRPAGVLFRHLLIGVV